MKEGLMDRTVYLDDPADFERLSIRELVFLGDLCRTAFSAAEEFARLPHSVQCGPDSWPADFSRYNRLTLAVQGTPTRVCLDRLCCLATGTILLVFPLSQGELPRPPEGRVLN